MIPAEYKETKIGVFPKEWNITTIEKLAIEKKGAIKIGPFGSQLKKDEMVDKGISVYGQENVFQKDFSKGKYFITPEKFSTLKSVELFPNDVVISMMGTIGDCCVVPESIQQGIMDSHLMRIQPNENITPHFMARLIKDSHIVEKQINSISQGAIMSGLNLSLVKSIKLPVPTIIEQNKIEQILSTVDDAIEKTDAIIKETQELKRGLTQKLFTEGIGHTRFKDTKIGRIPESWELERFQNIAYITDGAHKTPTYITSGVPFLRITDIKNSGIDLTSTKYISEAEHKELIKRCHPQKGDILYSKNGTIGITKIVDWDWEFSTFVSLALIRLKDLRRSDTNYIKEILTSYLIYEQILKRSKTGTITNLHLEEIRKFEIPLPPLPEQQKITAILSEVNAKIENERATKSELEELKRGLSQILLTGQKRVKV